MSVETPAAFVERWRRHHDAMGHTPTNTFGYCAEGRISAVWCTEGQWLRSLDELVAGAASAERESIAQAIGRGEWDDIFRKAVEQAVAGARELALGEAQGAVAALELHGGFTRFDDVPRFVVRADALAAIEALR